MIFYDVYYFDMYRSLKCKKTKTTNCHCRTDTSGMDIHGPLETSCRVGCLGGFSVYYLTIRSQDLTVSLIL